MTAHSRHDAHGAPPGDAGFDSVDFTVVDVETTGLSADRGDRVCEIGMVRIRGGAVMGTFGTLVDPTIPVSSGAYAVNGIDPGMLAGAPLFPGIIKRVTEMLAGAVIAAYNAPFDVSFLDAEFRLAGAPPPRNPVVDVLALARQLLPGRRRYPQSAVADLLRIPGAVSHRALGDAMVTAGILMHFLSLLKAYGRCTLDDLRHKDLGGLIAGQRAEKIAAALGAGGDLWIRYLSPLDGEVTQRIVTPLGGPHSRVGDTRTGEFEAFCHVLQAKKRFRLAYILDVRPVEPLRI